MRRAGERVLSQDWTGHWVLFDTATRSPVAEGDTGLPDPSSAPYRVDLAGGTVLAQSADSIALLDSGDGHLLASIDVTARAVGLAVDGSYAWAATADGLSAWSPGGDVVVDQSGNYATAKVFAAPGEIRVGRGPAGADVIQRVSTADNSSTTTPAFLGTFHSWFLDGERFLTTVSTAVRVYSKTADPVWLVSLATVANLRGHGDYISTHPCGSGTLEIIHIGDGATSSYPEVDCQTGVFADGTTIGLVPPMGGDDDINYVDVLDLSGPTIASTRHRLPVAAGVFAAESASSWAIAGGYFASGVVFDSDNLEAEGGPAPLSCGAAYTIAGSDSGQVAISTASGQILYVDLGTRSLVRVVNGVSGKVELSGDGSLLGATGDAFNAQYAVDPSVKVYAMPSGELLTPGRPPTGRRSMSRSPRAELASDAAARRTLSVRSPPTSP